MRLTGHGKLYFFAIIMLVVYFAFAIHKWDKTHPVRPQICASDTRTVPCIAPTVTVTKTVIKYKPVNRIDPP